jgi:hypothetical protein
VSVESAIDELYQAPLSEFTSRRNALAKTLTGADRQRVSKLAKPTVIPWTVNQLYWTARPLYERLAKSGQKLREAQIAALKGRSSDVRAATDAHRAALADAVEKGVALATASGSNPGTDPLARMLEALSLSANPPDRPGRFTEIVQPAGFEALSGISPAVKPASHTSRPEKPVLHLTRAPAPVKERDRHSEQAERKRALEEERRRREAAAENKKRDAEIKHVEQTLTRAKAAEARAREAFDEARRQVGELEEKLLRLRSLFSI